MIKTKKKFRITLLLMAALLVSGCGKKEDSDKTTANAPAAQVTEAASADTAVVSEEVTSEKATDNSEAETTTEPASNEGKIADQSETVEAEEVVDANMSPITADMLNDGEYDINVLSSSSMFKIESTKLKVSDGKLTVTMTMGGKGYLYVFTGTPDEAVAAKETGYIPFVENENGDHTFTFDIEALDQEIKCAAFSKKKEKWYDRSLCFTSGTLKEDAFKEGSLKTVKSLGLADGKYTAEVKLAGGSGKAKVDSPAAIEVRDGAAYITLKWSSSNYDYMIVDGEKIDVEIVDDCSTFSFPFMAFDHRLSVIADTTAMSQPYEIEYSIRIDANTVKEAE